MAVNIHKKSGSGFTVTPQAAKAARLIGLSGDVKKRLARMARRSSPLTHEEGNRRFGEFILKVEARNVVSVTRF